MDTDVPIIRAGQETFIEIPASVRFAILLPTARWTPLAQAIIGSFVGVASEEVAVLIADNSENADKLEFLKKIRGINPNIIAIAHEKNIGAAGNFFYLHEWCKNIEFSAIMADDDWMSPTYHIDSYHLLRDNPQTSGAAVGTTVVDIGDGKLVDVSQSTMSGNTPIERILKWNAITARATMYNASRRSDLDAAIRYIRKTPLHGMTLDEDLWELNRLALGDFLVASGHGCFVHYPAHGSQLGDGTKRFYELLCKDAGLQFPFVYFTSLSTAIQCAVFLMGNMSPIVDPEQRVICGQYVFRHIFATSFLPKVSAESSHEAAANLFVNHPDVLAGFTRYCNPSIMDQLNFDLEIVAWFIEIIKVFETKPAGDELPVSARFLQFFNSVMSA